MQLAFWNDAPEATARRAPAAQPRTDRRHVDSSPRGELATSPSELELEHLRRAPRGTSAKPAHNTRRAYSHDWRAYEQSCAAPGLAALPATPDVLALYLTLLAELGRRPSSIRRARIQLQGRWLDPRFVDRYIQIQHVPGRRNVAAGLL